MHSTQLWKKAAKGTRVEAENTDKHSRKKTESEMKQPMKIQSQYHLQNEAGGKKVELKWREDTRNQTQNISEKPMSTTCENIQWLRFQERHIR